MYNSLLVGIAVKVARFTGSQYNNSFLGKCIRSLSNVFNYLSSGSITIGILTKSRSNIDFSLIYRLYEKVTNIINIISALIRRFIDKVKDSSVSYSFIYNSFRDINSFLRTVSLFLLSTGIGIIGIGMLSSENLIVSIMVGLIVILVSFLVLINSNNAQVIITNSLLFKAVNDVFSIDKGGNQWW